MCLSLRSVVPATESLPAPLTGSELVVVPCGWSARPQRHTTSPLLFINGWIARFAGADATPESALEEPTL